MLSNALELSGLAALAAGVYVLAGLGFALVVAGAVLLVLGWATGAAPRTPRPKLPSRVLTNDAVDAEQA